ncbi:GAF domain-containing protein [Rufibacter latericius]|uniref:GAF domain-containing protein n=1 Tax=Rufibacter latericius TaxID=2487040 RepID=A0A3M9N1T5_9BACT|nr:GAF domain-containing protein [Rufibacter latericius]RNI31297.1 GAF domain-containing protein [Rufibacter latericius]
MLETWNPKLEVVWNADETAILDSAVLLTQHSEQASFVSDVLMFLYQHSGADIIMICHKTKLAGEMKILEILFKGQLFPAQATYPLQGTPCANVTRHGVRYFASGVKDRFPLDSYLRKYEIESYFGAPLMGSSDDLIGVVALQHQKTLENPYLLELLLTILSPSLEARLDRIVSQATS